jgi:hypothetical protein
MPGATSKRRGDYPPRRSSTETTNDEILNILWENYHGIGRGLEGKERARREYEKSIEEVRKDPATIAYWKRMSSK